MKVLILSGAGAMGSYLVKLLGEKGDEVFVTSRSNHDPEVSFPEEYALYKAREEDILREKEGGNWTIIRPYLTYSDERLQLGALEKERWLYCAFRGRTILCLRMLLFA